MKTVFRICRITIKQNRLFSVGLMLIFMLATAISFLGINFMPSVEKSFNDYLINYGMADLWYVTDPVPDVIKSKIENVEGIKYVDDRFAVNLNASANDGSVYSFRVFRYDENSPMKQKLTASVDEWQNGAVVSDSFAKNNPLKLGDELVFKTPTGEKHIMVSAFAYNPETCVTGYSDLSYFENGQFGYVYISRDTYDEMFGTQGLVNNWMIYFDDDTDADGCERAMGEIRENLGEHLLTEGEKADYIKKDLDIMETIGKMCNFVPGIAFLIAVGFSMLLLWQCVDNQQKTVGLLRAIGYTSRQTIGIYILYILTITTLAVIVGIVPGYVALKLCVNQYVAANRIAESIIEIHYVAVLLLCVATFLCAVLVGALSAGKISSIDPSKAYGGTTGNTAKPLRVFSRLHLNVFFKISLTSMFRNKKRIFLSSACIAVCIFCMTMILEIRASCVLPVDEMFGGRYCYSLLVHGVDDNFACDAELIEGVEKAEPIKTFSAEISANGTAQIVTFQGIVYNSDLVVPKDASGNRIAVRDGIVIEEMFAKENGISVGDTVTVSGKELTVASIARELVNQVMYVSLDMAESLAPGTVTEAVLLISDSANIGKVKSEIYRLNENSVIIEQTKQKDAIALSFNSIQYILNTFLILVFGIGAFIVFNMSVINFREKITDYAALRALGTPTVYYCLMFTVENIIQILIAIFIACPFSYFAIDILLKVLSSSSQQFVMTGFARYLFMSFLISFGYVLIGLGVSLFKVRKMDFIQCLNQAE